MHRMNSRRTSVLLMILLALLLVGFADSLYLTIDHFRGTSVICTLIEGCNVVLTSDYAVLFGVPLALLGALYYAALTLLVLLFLLKRNQRYLAVALWLVGFGFIFSLWLLYLQAAVLDAFCQFCLISTVTTTISAILILYLNRIYGTLNTESSKGESGGDEQETQRTLSEEERN